MSENSEDKNKFDLEQRTAQFGEQVIALAKRISSTPVNLPLIDQVIRASTSVGANYCEANNAESKKDFRHKIGLCRKESRETMHWLRMIASSEPKLKKEIRKLWQEAKELNLIFAAIIRKK